VGVGVGAGVTLTERDVDDTFLSLKFVLSNNIFDKFTPDDIVIVMFATSIYIL
jgi:hypothetical protein